MAYDVDKRPAEWVSRRAAQETRKVAFLTALALAAAVGAVVLAPTVDTAAVTLLAAALLWYRAVGRRLDERQSWVRGANAEASVGNTLNELRRRGYVVMHDVEQVGEGNIDHVVSGPSGVYLVETKYRRYDDAHLRKARRQAAKLKDEIGTWVTPVICLGRRDQPPFKADRVWVMGRAHVVEWIATQRNAPASFERLARWADRL